MERDALAFQALKLEREQAISQRKQRELLEDRAWQRREGGERAADPELREMQTQQMRRRSILVQALQGEILAQASGDSFPGEKLSTFQPTTHVVKALLPKRKIGRVVEHRRVNAAGKYPASIVLPKSIAKALPPVSSAPKPMSISRIEGLVADSFAGKMTSSQLVQALSLNCASSTERSSPPPAVTSSSGLLPSEAARAAVVMKEQSVSMSVAALRSVHDCKLLATTDLHTLVDGQRTSILDFVDSLVDEAARTINGSMCGGRVGASIVVTPPQV